MKNSMSKILSAILLMAITVSVFSACGEVCAEGHTYGDWTVITTATCENVGLKERKCKNCTNVDYDIIPTTDHDFEAEETLRGATCVDCGFQTSVCSACGFEKITFTTPLGHDFEETFTTDVPHSCEKEGLESNHCTRCHEVANERVVPAHDYVIVNEATASANGVKVCVTCGNEVSLPSLGGTLLTFDGVTDAVQERDWQCAYTYTTEETYTGGFANAVKVEMTVGGAGETYLKTVPNSENRDWSAFGYVTFNVYNPSNKILKIIACGGALETVIKPNTNGRVVWDLIDVGVMNGSKMKLDLTNVNEVNIWVQVKDATSGGDAAFEVGDTFYVSDIVGYAKPPYAENVLVDFTHEIGLSYIKNATNDATVKQTVRFNETLQKTVIEITSRNWAKFALVGVSTATAYESYVLHLTNYTKYSIEVMGGAESVILQAGETKAIPLVNVSPSLQIKRNPTVNGSSNLDIGDCIVLEKLVGIPAETPAE